MLQIEVRMTSADFMLDSEMIQIEVKMASADFMLLSCFFHTCRKLM